VKARYGRGSAILWNLKLAGGQRPRSDEKSSRRNSRLTQVRCHLPPRAVDISRSFNSRAMTLMETKPALRSLRIVGPKARTSATRLLASPLLILPLPDVIRPKRAASSLRRWDARYRHGPPVFLFDSVHLTAHFGIRNLPPLASEWWRHWEGTGVCGSFAL
jgi:hypothetical protein